MLKYAKKKGGSKSKAKSARKAGTKVALWKPCNVTRNGEFVNGRQTEKQAERGEIPRGHVHLPGCGCLSRAAWPDNYSAEFLAARESAKALEKRITAHQEQGSACGKCFTLYSLAGTCEC